MGIKDFFGFNETDENEKQTDSAKTTTSGVDRIDPDLETVQDAEATEVKPVHESVNPNVETAQAQDISDPIEKPDGIENISFAGSETEGFKPPAPEEEKGVSMISKEASVHGDIMTEGHIDVVGKVKGDISAAGNVAVQGSVTGNVAGEKIGLYECRINGNLNADTGIVADSGSTIVGDVMTKNLIMDGKLKGDVNASNVVVLRNNAYFIGDVATGSLAVEAGAVINGNVKMLVEGDPDNPFES